MKFWDKFKKCILVCFLIVNLIKLVPIISRRNRHVPAGDFARHSLWYPWKGYEHRWCEGITWQFGVCNDDWDDDSFLTKRSIRTIRVFLVCYARGPGFRTGGKIAFLADLARFCVCIVYRIQFCEKRDFGRLRSCSYSRKRSKTSFASVNMQKRARVKVEKLSNKISKSGPLDYWAAPYEAPVGTQQRQNMKKRARLKVEKVSNKIPKSGPVDYWAAPFVLAKSVRACIGCGAQKRTTSA